MTTPCWPSWHARYTALANSVEGKKTVASGCATVGGNVQCDPAAMAAKAGVSLPVYTLARYMQSEVGSGTAEERVAVGEAAVNRSKGDVLARLLYRQPVGHPNRGYFGPIHGPGGTSTAPYGRWAATSKDPTVATLALAELVMSGGSNDFAKGADDQNGMEYFSNPVANVREQAEEGDYWVGPLPGVNHWRTFLYRHYGVKPTTPVGAALLARGLAAVSSAERAAPYWSPSLPVCSSWSEMSGGAIVGLTLLGSAILGASFVGFRRLFERV